MSALSALEDFRTYWDASGQADWQPARAVAA